MASSALTPVTITSSRCDINPVDILDAKSMIDCWSREVDLIFEGPNEANDKMLSVRLSFMLIKEVYTQVKNQMDDDSYATCDDPSKVSNHVDALESTGGLLGRTFDALYYEHSVAYADGIEPYVKEMGSKFSYTITDK